MHTNRYRDRETERRLTECKRMLSSILQNNMKAKVAGGNTKVEYRLTTYQKGWTRREEHLPCLADSAGLGEGGGEWDGELNQRGCKEPCSHYDWCVRMCHVWMTSRTAVYPPTVYTYATQPQTTEWEHTPAHYNNNNNKMLRLQCHYQ